jgi:hypothetical protein
LHIHASADEHEFIAHFVGANNNVLAKHRRSAVRVLPPTISVASRRPRWRICSFDFFGGLDRNAVFRNHIIVRRRFRWLRRVLREERSRQQQER